MGKVKFLPTFSRPPPPHPKWAFTSIELYSNPMPSHTGTDWSVVSFGKAWFNSPHPWLFVELRVVDILNNVVMNTIWKAEITTVRSIKTQKFKDLLGKGCHRIPNIWYLVPIHYLVQLWPSPIVQGGHPMRPIMAPPSIVHKNEFKQQNETNIQTLGSLESPEPLTVK